MEEETLNEPVELVEDEEERTLASLRLNPLEAEARRMSRRPGIDHLAPGTGPDPETGEIIPLFDVGARIVVDRRCTFLKGKPWLDTNIYRVISINAANGNVVAQEEKFSNMHTLNFKSPYQIFKLAPKAINPFSQAAAVIVKKEEVAKATGEPVVKRGRGRPPGSKNRPKDVIAQEKAAYMKAMREKREARALKKRLVK